MIITNKTIIKKYEYAQVSLLTDSSNNKFIEKIQFHNPPVIPLNFQYDFCELEGYTSILKPLEIPHAWIIDSRYDENSTTFIMEYIDGINCENEPKAEYLYIAAEKFGEIYTKSKTNIARLDKNIIDKYTLCKNQILNYIDVIKNHYDLPPMDSLIDYIFIKYQNHDVFVNHGDVQFKNFIFNNNLHIIDWNVKISPFFTDLHSLIEQANAVNADEIIKRYCKFSLIKSISDEDIFIGGIIGSIQAVFELLIYDCPVEWVNDSYTGLLHLISKKGILYL